MPREPLSILATEIYKVLRARVPAAAEKTRITYKELVGLLPLPFANPHWHDFRLDQALMDLVEACRAAGRPYIAALVINEKTRQPGNRYYEIAHPEEANPLGREVAWASQFEAARSHAYPPSL